MINLAWGNYKNGSVPDSVTTSVDAAGHRLEKTAAANWLAMRQECFNATGKWLSIAPGAGSAGRTLSQQQEFWRLYQAGGNTAAYPGTSNHGWWRAADITGYETATSRWVGSTYVNDGPVWHWLMANMARFGFSWDTGRASKESWHFESVAGPGTTPASSKVTPLVVELLKEDDMKLVEDAGPKREAVGQGTVYVAGPGYFETVPPGKYKNDRAVLAQLWGPIESFYSADIALIRDMCLRAVKTNG